MKKTSARNYPQSIEYSSIGNTGMFKLRDLFEPEDCEFCCALIYGYANIAWWRAVDVYDIHLYKDISVFIEI